MRKFVAFAMLVTLAASACAPLSVEHTDVRQQCAFSAPSITISEQGDPHAAGSMLLQAWTIADAPELWGYGAPPGIEAWRAELLGSGVQTEPASLLRQSDTTNNRLVQNNIAEWVGPTRCLEALLLDAQNARVPLAVASTEFAAFVLRSADGSQLRIYSLTRNFDGVGNLTLINEAMVGDIAQGWTLQAGLHNHNFHPGEPELNGILAPSGPDAQSNIALSNRYGLKEAWITNGVHTVRIPSAAFARFSITG